jgi:hypothetical protein
MIKNQVLIEIAIFFGRNLRPLGLFLPAKVVTRESILVPLHLLIKTLHGYAIKPCQVGVNYDLFVSDKKKAILDFSHGNSGFALIPIYFFSFSDFLVAKYDHLYKQTSIELISFFFFDRIWIQCLCFAGFLLSPENKKPRSLFRVTGLCRQSFHGALLCP